MCSYVTYTCINFVYTYRVFYNKCHTYNQCNWHIRPGLKKWNLDSFLTWKYGVAKNLEINDSMKFTDDLQLMS
jgi:hypothetical protein